MELGASFFRLDVCKRTLPTELNDPTQGSLELDVGRVSILARILSGSTSFCLACLHACGLGWRRSAFYFTLDFAVGFRVLSQQAGHLEPILPRDHFDCKTIDHSLPSPSLPPPPPHTLALYPVPWPQPHRDVPKYFNINKVFTQRWNIHEHSTQS